MDLPPVAYVLDDVFLGHRAPGGHPERPERLVAIRDALRAAGLDKDGAHVATRRAKDDEIGLVHTAGFLAVLEREVPGKHGYLDEDTYFSEGSWEAALRAAGGAVDVAQRAISGENLRGLALVRPPGHHAEPDRAMGFCLLNNAAIAAAAARRAGCARVAVLDWDVHHGNGTQLAFWRDPSVMYLSTHQYPFYPGTGAADDTGEGEGRGTTVNVPLPAGSGDAEYAAAFDEVVAPALRGFRPELVIVSAGFDAFEDDPLAAMRVSVAGYRRMAEIACRVATEVCGGRMVAVLEGGYDLAGLGACATALYQVMRSPALPEPAALAGTLLPEARRQIDAAKAARTLA